MKQKRGKCWKLQIFQGKLQVFFSYLSKMEIVCSITRLYSSLFYSLFLPFFILKIFKFKYYKVFVRHSASISKFEWFEQPCMSPPAGPWKCPDNNNNNSDNNNNNYNYSIGNRRIVIMIIIVIREGMITWRKEKAW